MSNVILTLGGVAFRDFEVPEQIVFGGGQVLAVHQVIGGSRVVDILGAADEEISLAGVFSGPDAIARAQALDIARSLGGSLPLTWKGFFYSVVIAEFTAAYTKSWWIPFRLKLVVVQNLVAALPNSLEQAAVDVAAAQIYAEQGGLPLASITITNPQGVGAGALFARTALSDTGIGFAQSTEDLNNATETGAGITAIQEMTNSARNIASLASVQAYLGSAVAHLGGTLG
jgi:hypothetical protein